MERGLLAQALEDVASMVATMVGDLYASSVLPRVSAELAIAEAVDLAVVELAEESS